VTQQVEAVAGIYDNMSREREMVTYLVFLEHDITLRFSMPFVNDALKYLTATGREGLAAPIHNGEASQNFGVDGGGQAKWIYDLRFAIFSFLPCNPRNPRLFLSVLRAFVAHAIDD
jgi:hypothetical protein